MSQRSAPLPKPIVASISFGVLSTPHLASGSGLRKEKPGIAKKERRSAGGQRPLLAHRNVVIVALANKLARIAWAVLACDR